jgi:hypothetical protein
MPLRKSFADAIKIVNLTAAPSFRRRRVEGNEPLAESKTGNGLFSIYFIIELPVPRVLIRRTALLDFPQGLPITYVSWLIPKLMI